MVKVNAALTQKVGNFFVASFVGVDAIVRAVVAESRARNDEARPFNNLEVKLTTLKRNKKLVMRGSMRCMEERVKNRTPVSIIF